MPRDLFFYALSVVVITASFALAYYLPVPPEFRGFITLPGVTGLFSIIVQAWRDQRAHERASQLQESQQDFTLGIASHIANASFDHLLEFTDAYFQAALDLLYDLSRNGPTPSALDHAKKLIEVRRHYSPWIPTEVEAGLMPFERAIRQIAADAILVGAGVGETDRAQAIQRMFATFTDVIKIESPKPEEEPEESIGRVVAHLREVTKVNQLTQLRTRAIEAALSRIPIGSESDSDLGA